MQIVLDLCTRTRNWINNLSAINLLCIGKDDSFFLILSFEAGHITTLVHYAMAHWRLATTYAWPAPSPRRSGALLFHGFHAPLPLNVQTGSLHLGLPQLHKKKSHSFV